MDTGELVNAIIATLYNDKILMQYHKYQNGNAVQIKTTDGTYFNIMPCLMRAYSTIYIKKKDNYK